MSRDWPTIARRIRVPLGFVFAAAYLWFAQPKWWSLIAGAAVIAPGLLLRGVASGHVRKDREVTVTGPYAYSRNPLYLGSALIAAGFALAARDLWIAAALLAIFIAIYLPTVRSEEAYLRATFPRFAEYAASVPRFFPRFPAAQFPPVEGEPRGFSRELYLKHREYNAALGTALMLLALAARLLWFNR